MYTKKLLTFKNFDVYSSIQKAERYNKNNSKSQKNKKTYINKNYKK